MSTDQISEENKGVKHTTETDTQSDSSTKDSDVIQDSL